MECCICKNEIPVVLGWAEGNNAEPVVRRGRCCNECNWSVVIPARLTMLKKGKEKKATNP
jgi:hypothetical protein